MKKFVKFVGFLVVVLGIIKFVLDKLDESADSEIGSVSYKREYTTL